MGAFKRENTARGAWITSRVFLTALRMAARLMMAQNAATQASAVSSMASSLAEARNEVIRASDGAARDEDDGCIGRARILSWWGNRAHDLWTVCSRVDEAERHNCVYVSIIAKTTHDGVGRRRTCITTMWHGHNRLGFSKMTRQNNREPPRGQLLDFYCIHRVQVEKTLVFQRKAGTRWTRCKRVTYRGFVSLENGGISTKSRYWTRWTR